MGRIVRVEVHAFTYEVDDVGLARTLGVGLQAQRDPDQASGWPAFSPRDRRASQTVGKENSLAAAAMMA